MGLATLKKPFKKTYMAMKNHNQYSYCEPQDTAKAADPGQNPADSSDDKSEQNANTINFVQLPKRRESASGDHPTILALKGNAMSYVLDSVKCMQYGREAMMEVNCRTGDAWVACQVCGHTYRIDILMDETVKHQFSRDTIIVDYIYHYKEVFSKGDGVTLLYKGDEESLTPTKLGPFRNSTPEEVEKALIDGGYDLENSWVTRWNDATEQLEVLYGSAERCHRIYKEHDTSKGRLARLSEEVIRTLEGEGFDMELAQVIHWHHKGGYRFGANTVFCSLKLEEADIRFYRPAVYAVYGARDKRFYTALQNAMREAGLEKHGLFYYNNKTGEQEILLHPSPDDPDKSFPYKPLFGKEVADDGDEFPF